MPTTVKINDEIIPASVLKELAVVVDSNGGDAEQYCKEFGIQLSDSGHKDKYIPLSAYVELLEYCANELGLPFLGLQLAELQTLDNFGPIIPLLRSAGTLREALQFLMTYQTVHVPLVSYRLIEAPGQIVELCWTFHLPDVLEKRHGSELGVGVILQVLRGLLSPDFQPSYVRIAARGPDIEQEALRRQFGCEVLYGQQVTSVAFPAFLLGTELVTKDTFLVELMRNYLDQIRGPSGVPFVEQVELMINAILPFGSCTLKNCARQLGLAPRTLQSRLAAEGAVFSNMLEKQRRLSAESYLRKTQLPLSEIATKLGYSDQATFSRAFKGWTGMAPAKFRVTHQVNPTSS